ncbi:MAG: hypothetical protein P4L81_00470 [Candidatus Pacebacteria bacterium]|nr:hypothetical protein [Candidatus Paceibacterota bacterium]
MTDWLTTGCSYLGQRWERFLFGSVGGALLVLTFQALRAGNIAAGSALFGMGFFSFFYSNLARFKKFKGLGFEAELWDDKQKEAAALIERLKGIVSVYSHEIVMGSVMRGRLGPGSWKERWGLFDDIVAQHTELGQDIDFSKTKTALDNVFIFDICINASNSLLASYQDGKTQADGMIALRTGSPIINIELYNSEHEKLSAITFDRGDLFEKASTRNIARDLLNEARNAQRLFKLHFDINIDFDLETIASGLIPTFGALGGQRL